MDIIYSIFLGIIQGATEFLPISSSGHLVLAEAFLGASETGLPFDVTLHMGTLASLFIYFRADFLQMTRAILFFRKQGRENSFHRWLLLYLCLATVPAVVAGLLFGSEIETSLRLPLLVAATLAGVGLLLLIADKTGKCTRNFRAITFVDILLIGISQAFAIIPGVSRSGITMTSGLFLGLDRTAAARFSFLLSAPVILGAGVYNLPKIMQQGMGAAQFAFYAAGFISSALSGYLFIAFLLRFVQTRSLAVFAYYRFILAGLVLLTVVV